MGVLPFAFFRACCATSSCDIACCSCKLSCCTCIASKHRLCSCDLVLEVEQDYLVLDSGSYAPPEDPLICTLVCV